MADDKTKSFCSTEERVSEHTCNSLHPSISIDGNGNRLIIWHDNRDGNFEIYSKILPSQISYANMMEIGYQEQENGRKITSCPSYSGFSGYRELSKLCEGFSSADNLYNSETIKRVGTNITVNHTNQSAYITDDSANFQDMMLSIGAKLRFDGGLNTNLSSNIKSIIGDKVIEIIYNPQLKDDKSFIYIIDNILLKRESCETRLTCTTSMSLFPDIVSDKWCRSHILYQDNQTGKDQIYYVQIGYNGFAKKCNYSNGNNDTSKNFSIGSWGYSDTYIPNSFIFEYGNIIKYFKRTGKNGQRISYGIKQPPPNDGTKLHTIYKDKDNWVGLSKYYDRDSWNQEIQESPIPPEIVLDNSNKIGEKGDFGGKYYFNNLSFLITTPPDFGVELESIYLPLIPSCISTGLPITIASKTNINIIEAPKRPLPPTFVNPVDISSLLSSPYVKVDSNLPGRFEIEGDQSGTIYTNLVMEDARGQLNRIVFERQEDENSYKFILSMKQCGDGPCAVVPTSTYNKTYNENNNYSIKLQVWRGPDYRVDEEFYNNVINESVKVYEKEFIFSQGDDITYFSFSPNELTLNKGSMYYIVPIPNNNINFMIKGYGGGNVIWNTNGNGTMNQYTVPFTLPPYGGMSVPIYYDGYLISSERDDTTTSKPNICYSSVIGEINELENSTNSDPKFNTSLLISFFVGTNSGFILGQSSEYYKITPRIVNEIILYEYNESGGWVYYPLISSIDQNKNIIQITLRDIKTSSRRITVSIPSIKLCKIEKSFGSFKEGDICTQICTNSSNYILYRIPGDASQSIPFGNAWGYGEHNKNITGISQDLYGLYNNNIMVVNRGGRVYSIGLSGQENDITTILDDYPSSIVSVPNDEKYGPLSGKIVVGSNSSGKIFSINSDGTYQSYFIGICAEDIKVIDPQKDLFLLNKNSKIIYRMLVSNTKAGDNCDIYSCLFVLQKYDMDGNENGQLWKIKWNNENQKFVCTKLVQLPVPGFDYITFAFSGDLLPTPDVDNGDQDSTEEDENDTEDELNQTTSCQGEAKISNPIRITSTSGEEKYPSIAITPHQNVWASWHSNRNGSDDIFAARFFGRCCTWNSSNTGGEDIQVTNYSLLGDGSKAQFARVASDNSGNAHIVFQVTDKNGNSNIFYCKSKNQNKFTIPIKLTNSSYQSMMPDIAISYDRSKKIIITVVWHDNRFENWEIMSCNSYNGIWNGSGFGGQDTRITNSLGKNSMFPRIKSDKDGNVRLVYHSNRSGRYEIYMSSFELLSGQWISSYNKSKDLKVSNGPSNSLFPDIDIDGVGGVAVAWHDDRNALDNPDMHEEIYSTYCSRFGAPGGEHFPPLITNIEHKLNFEWEFVDCSNNLPIKLVNTENICLKIKAPNATFWRASNGDGEYSNWNPFVPVITLDTTVVEWILSCGTGIKEVCVQVQDQDLVSFPICHQIVLVKPQEKFEIEMFVDPDMEIPLPKYGQYSVAKSGDVYVKISSPRNILKNPRFDMIQKGLASIFNQELQPIDFQFSGFSGSTTYSGSNNKEDQSNNNNFSGNLQDNENTITSLSSEKLVPTDVSYKPIEIDNSGKIQIEGNRIFKGRFRIENEDSIYHKDGMARLSIKSKDKCKIIPSSLSKQSSEYDQDNIDVPPSPAFVPIWPIPSSPINWIEQSSSLILKSQELGISIEPTPNIVPYKIMLGGICQPFSSILFSGGTITFVIKVAKRNVPIWLNSFYDRKITFSLIKDFLAPSQSILSSIQITANDLPTISLDVISGMLEDPSSATDMQEYTIEFSDIPVISHGTIMALCIEDNTYQLSVGEYGANAKLFVIAIGTDIPFGYSPYYVREY